MFGPVAAARLTAAATVGMTAVPVGVAMTVMMRVCMVQPRSALDNFSCFSFIE
jgi:hypothetical protein